jgi:hypothetical protein
MLYTLLSFILALFLFVVGFLSLSVALSPFARTEVVSFILENSTYLLLFGIVFLTIGAISFFYLAQNFKRRYYTLKSGQVEIDVSERVIEKYLQNYFKELYPFNEVPCQIDLNKKRAAVIADLPYVPVQEQKALLRKIEEDLTSLFRDQIGFRHELKVSISFSPQ